MSHEKMFGCDPGAFLAELEGPLQRQGLRMVLMSMLSDVQEMVERGMAEEARQALNRVKLVIDRKVNDNNQRKRRVPSTMEVSLDGGSTYQPAAEGVRIVYKGVLIDGEDGCGEVHINATHEGLVTDIWTTRDEPLDHNIGTDSVLIEDIVSRLVAEND